jgi:hypothetical protein
MLTQLNKHITLIQLVLKKLTTKKHIKNQEFIMGKSELRYNNIFTFKLA